MVDPMSDLGEDVTEEDAPRCAACEEPILKQAGHRVVTWIEEGSVRSVHFCDESCRREWEP
ncbi:hypothetical protein BRD02_05920 [Halobacteriales archaeon QS_8_69_73]|nr:MAG: hypothetical protein BRD02_05920 [Halobacteriales archaeon QS_8_69_73]